MTNDPKMKVIFTVVDVTGKATRSTPVELEEFEQTRLARILEDFTTLSYFSMTVKESGLMRKVYYNPKQLISISIEEVK